MVEEGQYEGGVQESGHWCGERDMGEWMRLR